jgi:hypothetical protein
MGGSSWALVDQVLGVNCLGFELRLRRYPVVVTSQLAVAWRRTWQAAGEAGHQSHSGGT